MQVSFSSTNPAKLSAPAPMTIALPSPPFSLSTPPSLLFVLGRSAKKLPTKEMKCKAIVIDDAQISSVHFAALFYSGKVYLADVGSANGTRVTQGLDGEEQVMKHPKIADAQNATTERDVERMAMALVKKSIPCQGAVTFIKVGEYIELTLTLPEDSFYTSDDVNMDPSSMISSSIIRGSSSSSDQVLDTSILPAPPVKVKAIGGGASKKRASSSEPLGGDGGGGAGGGGRGKKKVMKQTTLTLPFQPPQFIGRPPNWGIDGEFDNTEATRALGSGYTRSYRTAFDDGGINAAAFIPTSDEETEEKEFNQKFLVRNFFDVRPGLRPVENPSILLQRVERAPAPDAAMIDEEKREDEILDDNGEPLVNFEDFIRLSTSQEAQQQQQQQPVINDDEKEVKKDVKGKGQKAETVRSTVREDLGGGGGGGGPICSVCNNLPTEIITAWNQFSSDMLKKRSNLSKATLASMFLTRRETFHAPISLKAPSNPVGIEGAELKAQPSLTEEAAASDLPSRWRIANPAPPLSSPLQEQPVSTTPHLIQSATASPPPPPADHLVQPSTTAAAAATVSSETTSAAVCETIDLQSPEKIKKDEDPQQQQHRERVSPLHLRSPFAFDQDADNDKKMDEEEELSTTDIDSIRYLILSDSALRMKALALKPLSILQLKETCLTRRIDNLSFGEIRKACEILNVLTES